MTLRDYIAHYISMPEMLKFFLVSSGVVLLIHILLMIAAEVKSLAHRNDPQEDYVDEYMDEYYEKGYVEEEAGKGFFYFLEQYAERYYELMFSATSILFFTGVYFYFDYFQTASGTVWEFWNKYQDFLLLGFITVSIIFNSILDRFVIPLETLKKEERGALRLAGMLYMLIVFAYIKFIYLDDNYDTILVYFLTLVIGRFVYFDASFGDFCDAIRELLRMIPILFLVLLSTALLCLYGFGTEYLLRSNGVVISTFIAHFFVLLEIFVIAKVGAIVKIGHSFVKKSKRRKQVRRKEDTEYIDL